MENKELSESLNRVKVFVYEEDVNNREKLRHLLESEGAIVTFEDDFEKVRGRIEETNPEVILIGGKSIEEDRKSLDSIIKFASIIGASIFLLTSPSPSPDVFSLDVDDWLTYPITKSMLVKRLSLHLRVRKLEEEVDNVERALLHIAQTVEMKELYGREHPQRVAKVALDIGELFDLDAKSLTDLKMGALLHDIGKVGVPEMLLSKPGKLTPPEFEQIKKHTVIGESLCRPVGFLQGALSVIRHHHERWDGAGYPDGLAGEEIPLLARIVSVSDAFIAFTSDRPFRKAFTKGEILSVLVGGAGSYWDPSVIWALLRILPR